MSKQDHFQDAYSLENAEDTKRHYKSWAETYDQEIGEENGYAQPARTAEALLRFTVPADKVVLDAGCGSGLSGVALTNGGFSCIDGCDFSPEMLQSAEAKGVYRHLFEADLNAGLNTISDSTYDIVTAVGVFSFGHVFPDACDEMLRVLKPGGLLAIALNEHFWDRGDLAAKIKQLSENSVVQEELREHGEHLPGHDVMGWVILLRKL